MTHKSKALLMGTVAGALLGAAFAWVASGAGDDEEGGEETALASLRPTDYFQLGIGILSLARQFGSMLRKA